MQSVVSTIFIIINILYHFNNQIDLAIIKCNFITTQHNLYMTHHPPGGSTDTQFCHIRRFYRIFITINFHS